MMKVLFSLKVTLSLSLWNQTPQCAVMMKVLFSLKVTLSLSLSLSLSVEPNPTVCSDDEGVVLSQRNQCRIFIQRRPFPLSLPHSLTHSLTRSLTRCSLWRHKRAIGAEGVVLSQINPLSLSLAAHYGHRGAHRLPFLHHLLIHSLAHSKKGCGVGWCVPLSSAEWLPGAHRGAAKGAKGPTALPPSLPFLSLSLGY